VHGAHKHTESALARKPQKVKVSERALFARINRKIVEEDLVMRRCPATRRDYLNLGDFYLVNLRVNGLAGSHLDLEAYGREIGALKDYEELE
jgi:hypothetical protein